MMKKIYIILFFCLSLFSFSQEPTKKPTVINLNLNTNTEKLTKTLNEGDYILKMKGLFECEKYKFNVTVNKNFKEYDVPKTPTAVNASKDVKKCIRELEDEPFSLESNTEVNVEIEIIDTVTKTVYRKIERTYTTIKTKKWITSYGIAGVKLIKTDTYRTIASTREEGKFDVVKGGSQEKYKAIPVMMFSVINLKKENAWIPSGGFGVDLENVTAFVGISKAFAQNFIITGGLAMHKQLRLDNEYNAGQILDTVIDFDDLNTDYFRVNPFISITFHLSENPFKK